MIFHRSERVFSLWPSTINLASMLDSVSNKKHCLSYQMTLFKKHFSAKSTLMNAFIPSPPNVIKYLSYGKNQAKFLKLILPQSSMVHNCFNEHFSGIIIK